ncbi:sulfotransferase family 2 domain-containing protein [Sedimentitalea sp. JM2-8]|uniref:Sulfotransferase family 2 domain-containing protein n=1 Tax=Sedimentitalea xiamensis TaxID=3050037 RepID=A0ABT7FHC5_9RHOB|nr:sulfotransferase family 2 domain-containing protein [Sedimentitalea xiamensis]MDK3074537.1 sulfotransferase family 2 domain-containing protein [Sedimentitalea xiamensis]
MMDKTARQDMKQALQDRMPLRQVNEALLISLRNRFMFARVPKVANSSLKHLIYNMEKMPWSDPIREDMVHDSNYGPVLRPALLGYESPILHRALFSDRFFRFTFVRNPYARALSGYLDRYRDKGSVIWRAVNDTAVRQGWLTVPDGEDLFSRDVLQRYLAEHPTLRGTVQDIANANGWFPDPDDDLDFSSHLLKALSAYVNGHTAETTRMAQIVNRIAVQNGWLASLEAEVDFSTYLRAIAEIDPRGMDVHVSPQTVQTLSDLVPYDHVGAFETLAEDVAIIGRRIWGREDAALGFQSPSRTDAGSRLQEIYTDADITLINRIYEKDFTTFGYRMVDKVADFSDGSAVLRVLRADT